MKNFFVIFFTSLSLKASLLWNNCRNWFSEKFTKEPAEELIASDLEGNEDPYALGPDQEIIFQNEEDGIKTTMVLDTSEPVAKITIITESADGIFTSSSNPGSSEAAKLAVLEANTKANAKTSPAVPSSPKANTSQAKAIPTAGTSIEQAAATGQTIISTQKDSSKTQESKDTKSDSKTESKTENKSEPKQEVKPKAETKPEPKPAEKVEETKSKSTEELLADIKNVKDPTKKETAKEEKEVALESAALDPKTNVPGQVFPEPKRKSIGLAGVDHALTKKYIELYQSPTNRQWLAKCLENSAPYRPYIRQKLKEKNMPMVLQYLPIIESNYKNTAVSPSGARGMWQFMENSMAPMLKKSEWFDERQDPWKAADAALIKLTDNYNVFGDWNIAIAAYNCGGGAMRRLLKEHPKADFWYLAEHNYLREETKLYVPKLLAVAELVENAEYYGLIEVGIADKMIEFAPVEEYEYVKMSGILTMKQLSEITKIPEETLTFLNPCLLKGMTPPTQYSIRVPKGTGKAAEEALRKCDIPSNTLTYKVQKGDTLWSICKKFNVSVDAVCQLNKIEKDAVLSIGQELTIPVNE